MGHVQNDPASMLLALGGGIRSNDVTLEKNGGFFKSVQVFELVNQNYCLCSD